MPKGPKYACATCGKWERISLKEHHKKVHQQECSVQFKGELSRVTCYRDADGLWRCPRCAMEFEGTPRKLQAHGLKGECLGFPESEQPSQDNEELEAPVGHDENMEAESDEDKEGETDENEEGDTGEDIRDDSMEINAIAAPDDILGNYIDELDDEDAFIKHLLDEDARDIHDVEIKLDMDLDPDWEKELLQSGPSRLKQKQRLSVNEEESSVPTKSHVSQTYPAIHNAAKPSHDLSPFLWADLHSSSSLSSYRPSTEDDIEHGSISRLASGSVDSLLVHPPTPPLRHLPSAPSPMRASASHTERVFESSIPSALQAFLATLRVPSEHLAPIFIRQRMTTDDTLDLLCEAPSGELEGIKKEILEEGRLAGWLAVQKGLEERARKRALRFG